MKMCEEFCNNKTYLATQRKWNVEWIVQAAAARELV